MEGLRRGLLWEIIRYSPDIFFILESASNVLKEHLSSDISYIHYFIEEAWKDNDIRKQEFSDCRNLIKDRSQ